MDIGNWVREARKASKMTQEALASALGLTKGNVSAWENDRHSPSVQQMSEIVRITGVEPPPEFSSGWRASAVDVNVSPGPTVRGSVPLLSWVQAGPFTSADDPCDVSECERVATTAPVKQRTFALRVENTSMSPDFPPGTVLIVEPDLDPRVGDYVIVANGAAEATFKQLVRDGDDWMLRPINPQFPVKPMPEHGRIVGVVVAAERKLR